MGFFTDINTHHALFQDEQLDTFDQFLSGYFEGLPHVQGNGHHQICLIARSPVSSVACALACRAADLKNLNVEVRVIFSHMQPDEGLRRWIRGEAAIAYEAVHQHMRWAKNPSLHDAHEQLVLGHDLCWSGDALRRSPDRRDVMDIYEQDARKIRMAKHAFEALWSASAILTKSQIKHLLNTPEMTPDATYDSGAKQTSGEIWSPRLGYMQTTRH